VGPSDSAGNHAGREGRPLFYLGEREPNRMDEPLYGLICEGPCNPNVRAIDMIVAAHATKDWHDKVCSRVTAKELKLQRTLQHTPPIVRGHLAHCTLDFTPRASGASA
jgi:hypothetical protein